jgi:hypothetical protein
VRRGGRRSCAIEDRLADASDAGEEALQREWGALSDYQRALFQVATEAWVAAGMPPL